MVLAGSSPNISPLPGPDAKLIPIIPPSAPDFPVALRISRHGHALRRWYLQQGFELDSVDNIQLSLS